MKWLLLDLLPAYISFEKQSTKADGTKINPAATPIVSIYEESGADANYDNSQIVGSPFNCAIINAKVGNYGVLIDKTLFTVGNIYRVLYEWTVDGITTAFEENFFALNSSSFKATVTNLDVAVSSRATPTNITTAHAITDAILNHATYGLSALQVLLAAIDTSTELAARFTEIKGSGWSITDTLEAIRDAINSISIENFSMRAGDGK